MVTAYQPSGEYKIMSGNLTMKVGDQVNLTVYDEKSMFTVNWNRVSQRF